MAEIYCIETRRRVGKSQTDQGSPLQCADDPTLVDYEAYTRQQARILANLCREGIVR